MAGRDWNKLIETAKTRSFEGNLVRCVPKLSYDKGVPPSYLFVSGGVNRCNPAGVRCLYLGEDRDTAFAEYDSYYTKPQPVLTFYGEFKAAEILDLGDPEVCAHFGFTGDEDFFDAFRRKPGPRPLQELGTALAKQTRIVAIRFPSHARHEEGKSGFNFAVFPDSIRDPDHLEILGDGPDPLERWP